MSTSTISESSSAPFFLHQSKAAAMSNSTPLTRSSFVLAPAVLAAWHPEDSALINDEQHVNYLNQEEMSWKAGVNERFAGMTYADVKGLLGADTSPHIAEYLGETRSQDFYDNITDVPSEFNAVTQWKGLVQPIRDQQQCGSCWAFSAAEVLSDRNAIQHNKAEPVLSPEDLVSCDRVDQGCNGGNLGTAWTYLKNTGIVTDACFPYTAGGGDAPKCETSCKDGSSWTKYKAASAYAVNGVENMQKEIMTHGPIQVAFNVYKSFMSYKSGVYAKKWYELMPEGGHAVKIVGWGTEGGKDYWLVANSWNTSWGDEGYFKIVRGSDNCGIETRGPPYAGLAAM